MGREQEKMQQRKVYEDSFKNVHHGHGGRTIKKKDTQVFDGAKKSSHLLNGYVALLAIIKEIDSYIIAPSLGN